MVNVSNFQRDVLTIMVRDPHWVFAYWTLSRDTGPGELTLRVHDVTDRDFDREGSHTHLDIAVAHRRGNWYIQVGGADRDYLTELGIKNEKGFSPLLRSNMVRTPRDTFADVAPDEVWMSRFGRSLTLWKESAELGGSQWRQLQAIEEIEKVEKAHEMGVSSGA